MFSLHLQKINQPNLVNKFSTLFFSGTQSLYNFKFLMLRKEKAKLVHISVTSDLMAPLVHLQGRGEGGHRGRDHGEKKLGSYFSRCRLNAKWRHLFNVHLQGGGERGRIGGDHGESKLGSYFSRCRLNGTTCSSAGRRRGWPLRRGSRRKE